MSPISFEQMKSNITFEKTTAHTSAGELEYRKDPLTGRVCVVARGLADKVRAFLGETDEDLIAEIVEKSKINCPFCPEMVEKVTPVLPRDIFDVDRLRFGEAVAFPNLFPRSEFEAVVVLSKKHCLRLDEFSPEIIADGFKACLYYIKEIYGHKWVQNAVIGCNYMFPAGASAVHPHMQVSIRRVPFYSTRVMLELGRKFFECNGTNYWEELIISEKERGERYVAGTGNVEFMVPFAPSSRNEVLAVVREKSSFIEFGGEDIDGLAWGMSRTLAFYRSRGLSSFNFALQSAPLDSRLEYFRSNLTIISRPNVRDNYMSDDSWFGSKLLLENVIAEPPEETAAALRKIFA